MGDDPQRDESGRWLPGRSGNPGGRPKNPWRVALEQVAAEQDAKSGEQAFTAIIMAMSDAARAGDAQAARLLLDRLVPVRGSDERDAEADLDRLLAALPRQLREPLRAALECLDGGGSPGDAWWAFERRLHDTLDAGTRTRIYRAAFDAIDLAKIEPTELDRRLAKIDPADIEAMDRVVTQLRTMPIEERLERQLDEPR